MAVIEKLIYLTGGVTKVLSLSADELNIGGLQIGSVSLSGTSGATLIGNSALSNYSGSTVAAQLSSIDSDSINVNGTTTFAANQPMGSFKLTGLAAGSSAGDSVRYEQVILRDGSQAFTAAQSMGSFKLTNVADPTSAQDAATKAYVDAVAQGLKPKEAVRVATTADIVIATGLNVGDSIDGITLVAGDRVLVKDQTDLSENGIYIVDASPFRSLDFDSLSPVDEVNGAYTFIQEGTQAGQGWVQTGVVATLDTDDIEFVYFNAAAAVIGGDMISVSGSTISVDLATVSGLESTNPGNVAGQLRVKLEASNPSLEINGSNELAVKLNAAGAITSGASGLIVGTDGTSIEISSNALRIASGSAGNGLGYLAGVLSVNVDDSTIEINTDSLRVKDAGITLAKLASNSVDENKIVSTSFNVAGAVTGGSGSKIAVQVDASTIEISANALRVKDAGITLAKLASLSVDENKLTSSVAGDGLAGGAGSALSVNVDDSTIEINTDSLRVKDAGIVLAKLASNSVDENKIVSTSINSSGALDGGSGTKLAVKVDGSTIIINGSNELEVQATSALSKSMVAGEAFAADTSFFVRWAISGETAGRVYKADKSTTSNDEFYAFGILLSDSALSAGDPASVSILGSHTLGASDSSFAGGDIGKPIFLQSSGAFSTTAPSSADDAVFRVGIVETTTKIFLKDMQLLAIY